MTRPFMKNTPREAIESAIATLDTIQNDHNIGCSGAIADLNDVLWLLPFSDEINTWELLRSLKDKTEEIEDLITDRVNEILEAQGSNK